ncbi:hypothetical protein [Mucilaginibacter mallensis]|nr:hypothetical protein [Mucilaginibacter mallensis]
MKKSSLVMFAALLAIASCQKNESKDQKAQSKPSTIAVTLNGIDKATAVKMMQNFINLRGNDSNPVKTSVWFDSATIHKMYRLLKSEGADGVRIYFISDGTVNNDHLENSIALVATKYNGEYTAVPWGMKHLDYYEHSSNDALFSNLKAINGVVNYGEKDEAVLYKTCNSCKPEMLSSTNNIHHISRSVAEQMVQQFGSHYINTISEWFDLDLFRSFAEDNVHDGIRIYFAAKPLDSPDAGRNGFLFTKTIQSTGLDTHVDDIQNKIAGQKQITDAQDNGEECPNNCN